MLLNRACQMLLLAIGSVLAVSASARGEEFREKDRRFSLQLPPGWGTIPKDALERANALANRASVGVTIHYVAGFQVLGQPPMNYPYVLVQPLPMPREANSYEDIEKALAKEFNAEVKQAVVKNTEQTFRGLVDNLAIGSPVLDRAKNRVVLRLEMNAPGLGKIQGLSIGSLGSKEIVFLHCYAVADEFKQHLPTFEALADSFTFDTGYAFTPGQGTTVLGNVTGGAVRGGLIGGVIGALVGVPFYVWSKYRKPKNPPAEENPFALRRG